MKDEKPRMILNNRNGKERRAKRNAIEALDEMLKKRMAPSIADNKDGKEVKAVNTELVEVEAEKKDEVVVKKETPKEQKSENDLVSDNEHIPELINLKTVEFSLPVNSSPISLHNSNDSVITTEAASSSTQPDLINPELDASLINRITVEVHKYMDDLSLSSNSTFASLKIVESFLRAKTSALPQLNDLFDQQWAWEIACAFHKTTRKRKHSLLRGIVDYGAEMDRKTGNQEHTWLELFFEYLMQQDDQDVIKAHKEAGDAADEQQYVKYQAMLINVGIQLPLFDEPNSPEEVPLFLENDLIMPKWLGIFIEILNIPQWRDLLDTPWRSVEHVLKSLGTEIGLERTEYLYLESLLFLKCSGEIRRLQVTNVLQETEEEKVQRRQIALAHGSQIGLEAPMWLRPLLHASYLKWKRNYENMSNHSRRLTPPVMIPPTEYSRVMGMLSYGQPIVAQPSLAMQKLYQHMWAEEPPNNGYLKMLREIDVIAQVNDVLQIVRGPNMPVLVMDMHPLPPPQKPSMALDICAFLSKTLETSLLPITDNTPFTPTKLPSIHLKSTSDK